MKKIDRTEKDSMFLKPVGRSTYLRAMLMSMKPGEIILIEPHEWTWKSKTPSEMCRRLETSRRQFSCLKSMEGKGWVIERLK